MIEIILKEGTRVLKEGSVSNGTVELYTVPDGKVFYLVAAQIAGAHYAAGEHEGGLRIAGTRVLWYAGPDAVDCYLASNSFPIPIVVNGGESIEIYANENSTTRGVIQGYEV